VDTHGTRGNQRNQESVLRANHLTGVQTADMDSEDYAKGGQR